MRFNIVMFKERYKNVIKVMNEGIYKPTFNAMCYLFENDIKNKKTLTAFNEILANFVEFEEINNTSNTAIIHREYIVDLSKMPIKIMNAINERVSILKNRKENISKILENKIVNLLNSTDLER